MPSSHALRTLSLILAASAALSFFYPLAVEAGKRLLSKCPWMCWDTSGDGLQPNTYSKEYFTWAHDITLHTYTILVFKQHVPLQSSASHPFHVDTQNHQNHLEFRQSLTSFACCLAPEALGFRSRLRASTSLEHLDGHPSVSSPGRLPSKGAPYITCMG